MDPSTVVATGPSNIPPPVLKPNPSQTIPNPRKGHHKRKRIASEASSSVAGDPPARAVGKGTGAGDGQPVGAKAKAEEKEIWSTPWMDGLGTTSYESKEQRLHDEIVAFYAYIAPSPEEAHARAMVINLISDAVTARFPSGTVSAFGSVAQNLYLPDGDTDLVIAMPQSYDDPETKKRTLFQLAALMRNNRVTPHVVVIHSARVPLISFQTNPDLGSLKVDISLNALDGVKAVPVLRGYFERMPALRFLVLCLKSLLSRHGLNAASGGGLSSYGVICLVISFLQLNPTGRPAAFFERPLESEALGVLLVDVLEYYGRRFDYETGVVSVNQGRVLTKEEKGWVNKSYRQALCIECLLHEDNDVGRPTSKVKQIRALFQEAHAAIQAYAFSDEPVAHNVLGTVLGVSDATLAHRALLKDVVSSGALDRARREVELSVSRTTWTGGRPPHGQYSSYPRQNSRPYYNHNHNGAHSGNWDHRDRDRPRNGYGFGFPHNGQPRPSTPAHHSLPPRPDSGSGRKMYVAQGPSFGALRAAAASANANGSGKDNNNEGKDGNSTRKSDASNANADITLNTPNVDANANTPPTAKVIPYSTSTSPGSRSPPRRRRKAQ